MVFTIGTTTDDYKRIELGANPHITIFNDDPINWLQISTNQSSVDGVIKTEEGVEFKDAFLTTIFVKSFLPGSPVNYRVWAYGKSIEQQYQNSDTKSNDIPSHFQTDFNVLNTPKLKEGLPK